MLDPNTHSVRVRGKLDNRDGHLLADMYGTMIVTVDPGKDSIVVPAECVVRKGTDSYVFVETGKSGNKTSFRRTNVKIEPLDVGFGVSDSAAAAVTADGSIRRSGPEDDMTRPLRIVDGLRPGQTLVRSGALGLFNEMEQQSKQ